MDILNSNLVLLAIALPLVAALIIVLGLPERWATGLAAVGFGAPAAIALWLWSQFPAYAAIRRDTSALPSSACMRWVWSGSAFI